jgi:hypothetical protein
VNVFITVDTEVWPRHDGWRDDRLARDIARDIHGVTPEGEVGIGYQMDVLDAHGLKGVYFLESLFACAVGIEPLRAIVSQIQGRGHDVQLHIHTEWLNWVPEPVVPDRRGQNMKDFTEDQQALLIAKAAENLRAAGATELCAFRAGNYGANFDTLRALRRNGFRFDSSHNTCYLDAACGMRTDGLLLQPAVIEGVHEYPVSFFRDYPGHFRHAQLCAVSFPEMRAALLDAWRSGWRSFVIVSHGFEMLRRRKQTARPPLPDRVVIRRYEDLCKFLSDNSDTFQTATFRAEAAAAPAASAPAAAAAPARPLRSPVRHAIGRLFGQLSRRMAT